MGFQGERVQKHSLHSFSEEGRKSKYAEMLITIKVVSGMQRHALGHDFVLSETWEGRFLARSEARGSSIEDTEIIFCD